MTKPLFADVAHGFSDKGPTRRANEDSFILPDPNAPTELGLIYVVADGVGGQEHGAEASRLAVRTMHDVFYQARQAGESVSAALTQAADQANLAIYDEAQERQAGRMGCTVVTAVHHQGQRYVLHAGDARAYLLRQSQLQKLTRDDTWVQRQVEEGLIGEDTAQRHELRHVVTRVLGNNPTAEFTVSPPMPIQEDDVLLLCSDGLHDVVDDGQMIQILAGYSPQTAAETLVDTAVNNNAQDNITALVVRSQPEQTSEATIASAPVAAATPAPETLAMTAANLAAIPVPAAAETAAPSRRKSGVRLPLWVLASLGLALTLAVIFGGTALFRQLRPADDAAGAAPVATEPVVSDSPSDASSTTLEVTATGPAEQPAALPTLMATAVPPPTLTPPSPTIEPTLVVTAEVEIEATAVANLACIVNGFSFVWQETQIVGSNCNQFAQEGFVLTDGDAVIILDATRRGVLGPDPSCQENEFIEVQSVADPAIEGWVLADNVQATTEEEGCSP